jgi:hypothetical protein
MPLAAFLTRVWKEVCVRDGKEPGPAWMKKKKKKKKKRMALMGSSDRSA